jgi:hypothetical protein
MERAESLAQRIRRWVPGGVVSIVFHLALLLVATVWYFSAPRRVERRIDATLAAGTFEGDELGDLDGLPGLDAPLELAPPPPPLSAGFQPLSLDTLPQTPAAAAGPSSLLPGPAGNAGGEGFGTPRFGTGTETVKGVAVQVGDPQFTLIWEGRGDLDLHVLEPGGSHIYWKNESRKGAQGGELDVDNRSGPGPENIFWPSGIGPEGEYRWYVHYYGPEPEFNLAAAPRRSGPLKWKLRVKHGGKTEFFQGTLRQIDDRSKTYDFNIKR